MAAQPGAGEGQRRSHPIWVGTGQLEATALSAQRAEPEQLARTRGALILSAVRLLRLVLNTLGGRAGLLRRSGATRPSVQIVDELFKLYEACCHGLRVDAHGLRLRLYQKPLTFAVSLKELPLEAPPGSL